MMVTIMTDNDDDVGDGGSVSSVGEDHENKSQSMDHKHSASTHPPQHI